MIFKRLFTALLSVIIMIIPFNAGAQEHTHIMTEELVEPTCSKEGYYYSYCQICGYSEDGKIIIPKTEHSYGIWHKDILPSCISTGREIRYCSVCNARDYRIVAATGKHISYVAYRFPATQYSSGEIVNMCKSCNIILSKKIFQRIKTIKLKSGKCVYNGKPKKPKVKVRDADGKVIPEKYYTLSYDKKPVKVGTYNVGILFINDYYGYYTLTYDVIPRKCKLEAVKPVEGGIAVYVKRVYPETDGVSVVYSTNKKFKKPKKYNTKELAFSLKGLKRNKTYYVKARAYSTVKGKKIYSKWTKTYKTVVK